MFKTFQKDTFSVRVKKYRREIFYCLFDITHSLKLKNGRTIKSAIERAHKCELKKFKADGDEYSFLTQEQLEYFLRLYSTSADFNAFIREIPYWYKSQEAKETIAKDSKVVEPQASVPSVVGNYELVNSQLNAQIVSKSSFDNQGISITSLEIAELTGKQHIHIKRDIRDILGRVRDISKFGYIFLDSMNRKQEAYRLPKIEALTLISGYSVELRIKIIERLEYLENELKNQSQYKLPQTYQEALRELADKQDEIEAQKQFITYQGGKLNDYKAVEKKRRSKLELAKAINKNVKLLAEQKFNKQYANAYNYIYSIFASHHNISAPIDMPYLKKNNDYLEEVLRIVLAELD